MKYLKNMTMKINRHQRTALYAGLIIIVIIGLFPPWTAVHKNGLSPVNSPLGYRPLFLPESLPPDWECDLNIAALLFSWLIAVILTGGAMLWLRDRKHPDAELFGVSRPVEEAVPIGNPDSADSPKRKRPHRARKLRKKKR